MKVKFWGVRGSIAAPGANTVHFGGNTSCYEIISRSGIRLILDAGTGIRELGLSLLPQMPTTVHLLISHTHWDHIQGFPFFTPAFVPGNIIHIYGPIQLQKDIASVMRMQMEHEVFPVREAELRSSLIYHNLGEGMIEIGDLKVRTKYTHHPVLTLSYRIEEGDTSLVYSGDTEPYFNYLEEESNQVLGNKLDAEEYLEIEDEVRIQNQRHIDFCQGADLLIHDAQYTEAEYLKNRRRWGHSPIEHAIHVGLQARVKRLALSHHDPTRTDRELFDLESRFEGYARSKGSAMDLFFAVEKQEIEL